MCTRRKGQTRPHRCHCLRCVWRSEAEASLRSVWRGAKSDIKAGWLCWELSQSQASWPSFIFQTHTLCCHLPTLMPTSLRLSHLPGWLPAMGISQTSCEYSSGSKGLVTLATELSQGCLDRTTGPGHMPGQDCGPCPVPWLKCHHTLKGPLQ